MVDPNEPSRDPWTCRLPRLGRRRFPVTRLPGRLLDRWGFRTRNRPDGSGDCKYTSRRHRAWRDAVQLTTRNIAFLQVLFGDQDFPRLWLEWRRREGLRLHPCIKEVRLASVRRRPRSSGLLDQGAECSDDGLRIGHRLVDLGSWLPTPMDDLGPGRCSRCSPCRRGPVESARRRRGKRRVVCTVFP